MLHRDIIVHYILPQLVLKQQIRFITTCKWYYSFFEDSKSILVETFNKEQVVNWTSQMNAVNSSSSCICVIYKHVRPFSSSIKKKNDYAKYTMICGHKVLYKRTKYYKTNLFHHEFYFNKRIFACINPKPLTVNEYHLMKTYISDIKLSNAIIRWLNKQK